MDLRDLQKMTVVKLREEALKHGGITGVHAMNKQQLIAALAPLLGIDLQAAAKAAQAKVAVNKTAIKQQIRALKAQRDAALAVHDLTTLKRVRQRIKRHKRLLRRLARQARVAS
ncbi:MAG: hypothetical protein KatS3mg131_1780 [Candidatus Tectimicrobiota bacterium]|nr:MAG: hypothetical protein KatS3mg131_1780 [Candidatus Tectomicrobia bacterium]